MNFIQEAQETLAASARLTDAIPETPKYVDDILRREFGWGDVAGGLTRILVGYLLVVFICFLAVALAFSLVGLGGVDSSNVKSSAGLARIWLVTAGAGVLSLLGLFSYGLIIGGMIRCTINASDRNNARWFIFACLVCLVIGPVINVASSFAGTPTSAELMAVEQGKFAEISSTPFGIRQIGGAAISILSTGLFVLFLRSIGLCFHNKVLSSFCEFYLIYAGALIGSTVYLVYEMSKGPPEVILVVGLGLGWFISAVWYVGLVVLARLVILNGMENLRSPVDVRPQDKKKTRS